MHRFVWSQLRFRQSRAGALGVGILVAAVSFTLLTSAAETSDLRVRGTVSKNWKTAYDILVRPPGSFTHVEREQGLVRENYLSGIFGGITFAQYRRIRAIPGVDVAAPIANVGYVLPFEFLPIRINELLTDEPVQLYRLKLTWLANNALSRYPGGDLYVYYTREHPFFDSGGLIFEQLDDGRQPQVCSGFRESKPSAYGPFDLRGRSYLLCFSSRSPDVGRDQTGSRLPRGFVGSQTDIFFPIFVSAIDPEQEARLLRLDRAIVGGRYLAADDGPKVLRRGKPGALDVRVVPVIASTRTYLDEKLQVAIERLAVPPRLEVASTLAGSRAYPFLNSLRGHAVARKRFAPAPVYERMIGNFSAPFPLASADSYWQTSSVRYGVVARDRVRPITTANPIDVWTNSFYGENGGYLPAPLENKDVQFRRLHERIGSNQIVGNVLNLPSLKVVGRFDPAELPGFSPLSRVPLETYYPPKAEPADEATRQALAGRPLLPTQNLGDYIAQPPLMLTTLKGLSAFTNRRYFQYASPKAPISVIRVRVAGVAGPDRLSRERIRRVAQDIHDRTGLAVDVTAGSSPHPLLVELPAGKFGRPELLLQEGWVKKGVAVAFLTALDEKSLALFGLILIICAFFLANGALASVNARRTEIGTLLCLGWSRGKIFTVVLAELAFVGLLAGAAGTALAAILVKALSLEMPLLQTLLVAPVAVALAVLAGLVPSARAARAVPLDALRPAVSSKARGRAVRSLLSMALANLLRVPGRTLLGSAGLFLGVAALAVLVAVNAAFQGTLVDTLLGQVISVQIRPVDFLAVGLTVLLGGVSVADVVFLNLRERAPEIVTLRTSGWRERDIIRLVSLEALGMGLLGSVAGGAVGVGAVGLIGLPMAQAVWAAAAAAALGTATAFLASLVPLTRVRQLTPATVLAGE
jgi:putative ABC transport system permease protein